MSTSQLRGPHCPTLVDLMGTLAIIRVRESLTATLHYLMEGQEAYFINNDTITAAGARYYRLVKQFQQGGCNREALF